MPYTDKLHAALNSTRHEVGEIYKAGESLARSIDQLVQDFIERHGGDLDDTMKGINDSLADLIDDVSKPKLREIEDLERRIADAERADLMRHLRCAYDRRKLAPLDAGRRHLPDPLCFERDMKSALHQCTESLFKHAYAARRLGRRDKQVIESLIVMSYVPSRRIGRAALRVLREIRTQPNPQTAA